LKQQSRQFFLKKRQCLNSATSRLATYSKHAAGPEKLNPRSTYLVLVQRLTYLVVIAERRPDRRLAEVTDWTASVKYWGAVPKCTVRWGPDIGVAGYDSILRSVMSTHPPNSHPNPTLALTPT